MTPVMTRITTTHAVADKNNRVASELPRIRAFPRKACLQRGVRWIGADLRTESCPHKRTSRGPDQYRISSGPRSSTRSSSTWLSRIWRRRCQQIAKAPHRLDDIDVELLADAADENFNGVGVAVEVLVVKMFDQFGTRHHAPGMVHEIGQQPVLVRGH